MPRSDALNKLLDRHHEKWHNASHHRFTTDSCNGTLSDSQLYTYLMQDQMFFMTSIRMLARTIQLCNNDTSTIILGKQLALLCGDENTYFDRCLRELKQQGFKHSIPALPEIQSFLSYSKELIQSHEYIRLIIALYTFERVYLLWAEPHEKTVDHLEFKHKEWVYLHCGPEFSRWVEFLEQEVVRSLSVENEDVASREMERVLDLEWQFFDATYNYR